LVPPSCAEGIPKASAQIIAVNGIVVTVSFQTPRKGARYRWVGLLARLPYATRNRRSIAG